MSQRYGYKERLIAGLLAQFPFVKKYAKMAYQRLNYRLYKKKYLSLSYLDVQAIEHKGQETFYGYYDHSPLNTGNRWLIFHASKMPSHKTPDPEKPVQIVLMDFENRKVKQTFESKSYNWQQGTRLQWLDESRFIFNDFDPVSKNYFSKIIDVCSEGNEKRINFPIYDCFNDYGLGLNFDRLMLMRPDYGYFNHASQIKMTDLDDATDGIWRIDFKENKPKLLFSIDDLKKLDPHKDFRSSIHKVNHIMISPSGDKFIFLHRWFKDGIKTDRLILADQFGKNLRVLAQGIVSHFSWFGSDKLFGFLAEAGEIGHYTIIDLKTGEKTSPEEEALAGLGDGHPNIFENKAVIDTYPNKSRMQELFVFDMENFGLQKAGEFFEGFKFEDQSRCDLHPSWSLDGKRIFIDSVHSGKRQLYCLKYGG
jgi:hypothetical protein